MLLTINSLSTKANEVIRPEETVTKTVSNRDVNRIHCPSPVQDVIWSQEKPVAVTTDGNNVFVKFKIRREGMEETRVSTPLDLTIICGQEVYSLILNPVDMDLATIRLGNGQTKELAVVAKEWGALPLEEKVKKFTLITYKNELPNSFRKANLTATDPRRNIVAYSDLSITGLYEVRASGTGLRATEYEVTAKKSMALEESDFLLPEFGDIAGITIDPLHLSAGQSGRLIIIDRSLNSGQ